MTPAQAAALLTRAAAFDNRTIGETDAEAWAAALHDMPFDTDTLNAVARYYSAPTQPNETGRRWIEPHHVRTWRRRIRDERLGDTIPAYEPIRPDETGAQYVTRRRAQLTAIADGTEQPIPIRALAGGPHPSLARALATVGRDIPTDDETERPYMPAGFREEIGLAARPPELRIPCPKNGCGASARQPCRTPMGRTRTDTHQARKDATR